MATRTKTKTTRRTGRGKPVPKQGGLAGVLSIAGQVLGKGEAGKAGRGRAKAKAKPGGGRGRAGGGVAALAATGVGALVARRRRAARTGSDVSVAPEVPATGATPGAGAAAQGDRDIVSPSPAAPMGGL